MPLRGPYVPRAELRFEAQAGGPLLFYRQLQPEVLFPQQFVVRLGVRHIGFQAPLFGVSHGGLRMSPRGSGMRVRHRFGGRAFQALELHFLGGRDTARKKGQQEAGPRRQADEHDVGQGRPVQTPFQEMHIGEIWHGTYRVPA